MVNANSENIEIISMRLDEKGAADDIVFTQRNARLLEMTSPPMNTPRCKHGFGYGFAVADFGSGDLVASFVVRLQEATHGTSTSGAKQSYNNKYSQPLGEETAAERRQSI